MSQLTFFAEEPPVSPSVSQDSEKDWMTRVATSCLPLVPLLQNIGPAGWYGRTSPASSAPKVDETLQAFWASSAARLSKSHPAAGATAESSREFPMPTALPIGCWTLSTSEWNHILAPSLKDEGVCSLSDILETGDVPRRYFLSAKACLGILRRAEKRGKDLPPALLRALQQVAGASSVAESRAGKIPLSLSATTRKNGDQVTTGV
jgi:hypothetical protein